MKSRFTNIFNAKKKRSGAIILLAVILTVGILGGMVACTVTRTMDIQHEVNSYLDMIVDEKSIAFSSNPYDYINANSEAFYALVALGDDGRNVMLDMFEKSNDNGLKEYIMAIACNAIKPIMLGDSIDSGRTWYETLIREGEKPELLTTVSFEFTQQEVADAKAVVERYFKAFEDKDEDTWWATWGKEKPANAAPFGDWTITLKDICYNPQDAMRESYVTNGSVNNPQIENVIVFKCDFNVRYPDGIPTAAWNEGDYTDWSVILVRQNASAEWLVAENGY